MDSVLGVGAATESRIRFSWRAARHDGSADRRRVAGDHRAPLRRAVRGAQAAAERVLRPYAAICCARRSGGGRQVRHHARSEEHTSELQSLMRISYAVFCLKKQTYVNKEQSVR